MTIIEIVLLALALSMDAAAVAAACSAGLRQVNGRQVFRFGFHFGLFQALMPVIGWIVGQRAQGYVENWDHWIAAGLLFFVGVKAIHAAFAPEDEKEQKRDDPTKGWTLIVFSVATSIDALAVGFGLAMSSIDIVTPAICIGLITASMTVLAMFLGSKIGKAFGSKMEIVGGLVLIGIGIKILLSHIL